MRGELYHHGILGQKWGKKNGPPYPLNSGSHSISEKKAGWRKSLGGKTNEHLYDRKKKSLSDEQKRKIKRAVGVGLLAVGVGTAGYFAYKTLGKKKTSYVLKKGTTFTTLAADKDRIEKGEYFYTTFIKGDSRKYKAFFGKDVVANKLKYDIKMGIKDNIKIANDKDAFDVFKKLYNSDSHFAASVNKQILTTNATKEKLVKGAGKIRLRSIKVFKSYKDIDKFGSSADEVYNNINTIARSNRITNEKELYQAYTRFNINYVVNANQKVKTRGGNEIKVGGSYAKKAFAEGLKKSGYSGFLDLNDKGALSKAPTVVIDKSKFYVKEIRQLSEKEVLKDVSYSSIELGKEYIADKSPILAGASIYGGVRLVMPEKDKKK